MAIFKKKSKDKEKKAQRKADPIRGLSLRSYEVIASPYVSEKSAYLSKLNQYIFKVSLDAKKPEIISTCKEVFGETPVRVNLVKVRGKKKRFGAKIGKRKDWKKAIVTIKKGKELNVFENV